jgi:hypothetical protein
MMENSVEQAKASKYNDSMADAIAALAVLSIAIAVAVFWVSGH